jgi:hypothetical protein
MSISKTLVERTPSRSNDKDKIQIFIFDQDCSICFFFLSFHPNDVLYTFIRMTLSNNPLCSALLYRNIIMNERRKKNRTRKQRKRQEQEKKKKKKN